MRPRSFVRSCLALLCGAAAAAAVGLFCAAPAATAAEADAQGKIIAELRALFGVKLLPHTALDKELDRSGRYLSARLAGDVRQQFKRIVFLIEKKAAGNALLLSDSLCRLDGDGLYPAGGGMMVPVRWLVQRYLDETVKKLPEGVRSGGMWADDLHKRLAGAKDVQLRRELATELTQRFLYRKEGVAAAAELVDILGGQADYERALAVWAQLLQVKRSFKIERPVVLLRLATCCQATGRPARAAALARLAAKHYAGAAVKMGGRELTMKEAAAGFLRQLEQAAGPPPLDDWPMFGGNARRSASATRTLSKPLLCWRAPVPGERRFGLRRKVAWRSPTYPVMADGVMYFQSGESVEARDVRTGELTWTYMHGSVGRRTVHATRGGASPHYWTLAAADGRLIWVASGRGGRTLPWNTLIAMKARPGQTKPELLWSRGGPTDPDPVLRTASFASGVLVHDGRVYTTIYAPASEGEYMLCSFNVGNGWLVWRTGLSFATGAASAAEALTELAPVTDGSTIYCATGNNLVAAVDAKSGKVRWMTNCAGRAKKAGATAQGLSKRPLVLRSGVLLVTPKTPDALIALDALTGAARWSLALDVRGHMLGVQGRGVYLSRRREGKTIVKGVNARTGEQLWETTFAGMPTSGGLVTEKQVWCPMRRGVQLLDTATGKLIGAKVPTFTWRDLGFSGALLGRGGVSTAPCGRRFVFDSGSMLTAVFSDSFGEELAQDLARGLGGPEAHVSLARWQHFRGQLPAAAANYRKAVALFDASPQSWPPEERARAAVGLAAITEARADQCLARKDEAGWEKLIREAIGIHKEPAGAARLTYRLAAHLGRRGKPAEAVGLVRPMLRAPSARTEFVEVEEGLRSRAYLDATFQLRKMARTGVKLEPELAARVAKISGLAAAAATGKPLTVAWELSEGAGTVGSLAGGPLPFFNVPGRGIVSRNGGRAEMRDPLSGRLIWAHSAPCLGIMVLPSLAVESVHPRMRTAGPRIEVGDKISKVDGKQVSAPRDIALICARAGSGKKLAVDFVREGKPMQTTVVLSHFGELYPDWPAPQHIFLVEGGSSVLTRGATDMCEVLDAATGKPKRVFALGTPSERVAAMIAFDSRVAAFVLGRKREAAVVINDITTGKQVGRVPVAAAQRARRLLAVGNHAVIIGRNAIASFDAVTAGAPKSVTWVPVGAKGLLPRGVIASGKDHLCVIKKGSIEGWSAAGPKRVWQLKGNWQPVAVSGNLVFVASGGELRAINLQTGALAWKRPCLGIPVADATAKALYFSEPGRPNTVQALSLDKGQPLWHRGLKRCAAIKAVGETVFVASESAYVMYGLSAADGKKLVELAWDVQGEPVIVAAGSGFCVATGRFCRTFFALGE